MVLNLTLFVCIQALMEVVRLDSFIDALKFYNIQKEEWIKQFLLFDSTNKEKKKK